MQSGQTDARQVEDDSESLIKGLQLRFRIVLVLALSLIACGLAFFDSGTGRAGAGTWMLLIGILLLPGAIWLHSQRKELAKKGASQPIQKSEIANQDSSPQSKSLIWIVASRGIVAGAIAAAAVLEPILVLLLGVMAGAALLMAVIGTRTTARVRMIKFAIYGAAAILAYVHMSGELSKADVEVDVLAGKLEEYKRRYGVYPEKLDAMIPELIPSIPKPGLGLFYSRENGSKSYSLSYRRSARSLCNYTPEQKLKCHSMD